jgi:geranylgeranyl reductase family protein
MREALRDVLVVGAGPAGCAAAYFLGRAGVDVLMVDRAVFPRDKVCGDGLAPRSVAMLRRLGLEGELADLGFKPFSRYRLVSSWGDAVAAGVPSYGRGLKYAYVVPRRLLDALLLDKARTAGVEVREGVRALRTEASPDPAAQVVLGVSADGEMLHLRAKIVVCADGSRGSFSRSIIPREKLRPTAVGIRAYMEGVEGLGDALNFFLDRGLLPGYGWIFPGGREGEPANVGLGLPAGSLRRRSHKLARLFKCFIGSGSLAWPHLKRARLVSKPATFPLLADLPGGCRRSGSILFVGDSANLTDPLSGEGIAYALESGFAAAGAIVKCLHSGRVAELSSYEDEIQRTLWPEFLGALLLRQVLAQPWGNGLVTRLLQRNQALAEGGIGILANTVPASWLLTGRVWRRMLSRAEVVRTLRADQPARG